MADPSNPATTATELPPQQSNVEESPHRHATLKKKTSIKRNASKRSKADTVGSTTLSPTSPTSARTGDEIRNDVTRSPLYCPVPTNADPTVVLAARFQAWRGVVKEFINYFKSVSSIEDTRSRNIAKLNNSLTVPFRENNADEFFIESGGVQDIGIALKERARQMVVTTSDNSKKILTHIIPPLEKLRSDLHLKIKEIKGLSGDFKNSVPKEQEHTKRYLQTLSEALTHASERPGDIVPKNDPHLAKMAFERQLRHHLQEENFLHQAHRNIESSGRALEGLVVKIIRDAFTQYQEMLSAEANATSEFAATIGRTGAQLPVDKEWDSFIADAKDMVDPAIPIRTFKDIDYPGSHQVTLIRSGRLERKSKYLKSYSSAFYILTAVGYFHEFKSSHMQDLQVSLFLPSCTLGGHSSPEDKSHKFVLKGNQTGGMHRGHNWVFRAETHEEMLAWYKDIEQLVQLPHMSLSQRQTFIASHAPEDLTPPDRQRQSGSSSPGLDEDEADEVPYSQDHSAEESSPTSPLRPAPGGSFPSETRLDESEMVYVHSRTASDVTSEIVPPRISREEDVVQVFGRDSDLERPYTQGTEGSIGDDKDFMAAAAGVGVGAAAGGLAVAQKNKNDDLEREIPEREHSGQSNDLGQSSKEVVGPHEAAQYYSGTNPLHHQVDDVESIQDQHDYDQNQGYSKHQLDDIDRSHSDSTKPISNYSGGYDYPSLNRAPQMSKSGFDDFALGLAGGAAGGAGIAAIASSQRSRTADEDLPASEVDHESAYSASATGDGIETRPPVESDVLPAEINGIRQATQIGGYNPAATNETLAPPTSTIRRSKSKKEIVEETIAESIGNHPERGQIPGFWPETPAQEISQDGMFKRHV